MVEPVVGAAEEVPEEDVPGAPGTKIRWLLSPGVGAPNFSMRLFSIAPGGRIPEHSHDWEHEIYVLSGRGVITISGRRHEVGPGTYVLIPPNLPHGYEQVGPEELRFLCLIPNRGAGGR